ncbi:hypothetical protein O181_023005 [Austropuccinia psidii MF-1]|uniref:Uncharacterized protein n=1 Tax=Austropuccinia psidii MF-1 TaxID=1389203 RepID=A0A9Q3CHQ0_9BASI|nr:hypothetical protein [Austropuccinia psidii MF-1]
MLPQVSVANPSKRRNPFCPAFWIQRIDPSKHQCSLPSRNMLWIKLLGAFPLLATACHAILENTVLVCTTPHCGNRVSAKLGHYTTCKHGIYCIGCGKAKPQAACNNAISKKQWKCTICLNEGTTEDYDALMMQGCEEVAKHRYKCSDCYPQLANTNRVAPWG